MAAIRLVPPLHLSKSQTFATLDLDNSINNFSHSLRNVDFIFWELKKKLHYYRQITADADAAPADAERQHESRPRKYIPITYLIDSGTVQIEKESE